ncbi:hypothetical protein BLSTO_02643 [Blastocystis sp. subtype 1]
MDTVESGSSDYGWSDDFFDMLRSVPCSDSYFTLALENGQWVFQEGIARLDDDSIAEINEEFDTVVNVHETQLISVNGIIVNTSDNSQILNLSDEGDRWEGAVLDDQPCGWGTLYDKDNNVQYEGFRYHDSNVCYGIAYYADIRKIEYEGELCSGKRWGHGAQYDRNGKVVYEGDWINGEQIKYSMSITKENEMSSVLHSHLKELIIGEMCFNTESLTCVDFSKMPLLTKLSIGDECFNYAKSVSIIGMDRMKPDPSDIEDAEDAEDSDAFEDDNNAYLFVVARCKRLKELRIGLECFRDFDECIIEDNPALEVIEMGSRDVEGIGCLFYSASLFVTHLPALKTFYCSNNSFSCPPSIVFEDLPSLETITLDNDAMSFDEHVIRGSLTLKNLPKLTSIIAEPQDDANPTFAFPIRVHLESVSNTRQSAVDLPSLTNVAVANPFLMLDKWTVRSSLPSSR